MTIIHHVRCDACDRLLANGPTRQAAILTLTQDIAEPQSITNWHFCHQGCLASWLTKAARERAAAEKDRAERVKTMESIAGVAGSAKNVTIADLPEDLLASPAGHKGVKGDAAPDTGEDAPAAVPAPARKGGRKHANAN